VVIPYIVVLTYLYIKGGGGDLSLFQNPYFYLGNDAASYHNTEKLGENEEYITNIKWY
jgi:hypothetical protein